MEILLYESEFGMGPEIISRIHVPYTIINTRFIPDVYEEKISLGSSANPRLGMKVLKRYPKPYMKNKNPKQNLDGYQYLASCNKTPPIPIMDVQK